MNLVTNVRFPSKPLTDVSGCQIVRVAPSKRGRGAQLTARHRGRSLPEPVAEAALAAATSRRPRK